MRRQTTPSPGRLADKGTKGKRARDVPLILELRDLIRHRMVPPVLVVRELVQRRIAVINGGPDARLFTGPAEAGSPPRFCVTPRTGTRSSRASGTSCSAARSASHRADLDG